MYLSNINEMQKVSPEIKFYVEKRPIYFHRTDDWSGDQIQELIPNRYALIRTDTMESLSVVTEKYKLRMYEELVQKVSDVILSSRKLSKDRVSVKDWTNRSGSKFRRDVIFWDHENPIMDANKEKTVPHLRVYASYDSSWAEQIIFGSVYVLCMNGLVRPDWQFRVYNRHSAKRELNYSVELFESGLKAQEKLGHELKSLIRSAVTSEEVEKLFKNTLAKIKNEREFSWSFSDKAMKELSDLWTRYYKAYGSNLFAVYQAATHWSSYPITRGDKQLVVRRREDKVSKMLNHELWSDLTFKDAHSKVQNVIV